MKISYAITVCNELEEVTKLLNVLLKQKRAEDEIVVLFDKGSGTAEVWDRLQELKGESNTIFEAKTFKKHFADWKNHLTSLCSGDYIFQIDADEIPHTILLEALPEILKTNPDNEVYLVPRVNTVKGIRTEHVKKWGWRLSNEGWVNWPDYQWRIWKNKPEIKWVNKVHEKLDGFLTYAPLPKAEQYALYHPKTIEKQEKQNAFYETI